MKTNNDELIPCPFCDGEAVRVPLEYHCIGFVDGYDTHIKDKSARMKAPRAVYVADHPQQQAAQAAVPQGKPLFWYRPRSDGCYEGPIHNDSIERVRVESGAWKPLYTAQTAPQAVPMACKECAIQPCESCPDVKPRNLAPQAEPVLGTKTWFDGEKVITQYLTASDIYKDQPAPQAVPQAEAVRVQHGWNPTDEELTTIYKKANGEDVGKAQPLTTQRIFTAMRALLAAAPKPQEPEA